MRERILCSHGKYTIALHIPVEQKEKYAYISLRDDTRLGYPTPHISRYYFKTNRIWPVHWINDWEVIGWIHKSPLNALNKALAHMEKLVEKDNQILVEAEFLEEIAGDMKEMSNILNSGV